MHLTHAINFGPYRLDPINAQLWRGEQALSLPPRTFAVLCYLAEHPRRLVTKEELLDAVWGGRCVSEGVLKTTIQLLRKVLQDDSQAPRYIETQPRRGYRFIAAIRPAARSMPILPVRPSAEISPPPATPLVGREGVLDRLQGYLQQALAGEHQLVFVTGEPGIGKTALIQTFLQQAAGAGIAAACGECVEQYGTGEPYLPVLEALNALCYQGGEPYLERLRQYAPTWLAQLPWFLTKADRALLQREVLGATKERMLRELGEWLEQCTVDDPLILVLEDLHWSDYATLDLLSYLARRARPACRLIVGTYRPVEVVVSGHPLRGIKQELQLHRLCEELPLELLSEQDVAQYLSVRFGASPILDALTQAIHARTEGLPLCLVHVVDDLIARRQWVLVDGGWRFEGDLERLVLELPDGIRHLIERQFERLAPEQQQLLEVASVAGVTFSAAAVAAVLKAEVEETDARCEGLVRSKQFVHAAGGAHPAERRAAGRYDFIHAFYHEIAYARLSPTLRADLHRRLGEWQETISGMRAGELAAELALHFEQGRDYPKAVGYLRQAADNAARRYANREAIGYLTRALELVERLTEAEGAGVQIAVLEQRGRVRRVMADMGGAAEDFQAMLLCARAQGVLEAEARALLYLAISLAWIDRSRCLAAVDQAEALSHRLGDGPLCTYIQGWSAYWNLLWRGFRAEDASACATAVEAARRAGERAQLSGLTGRFSYFQSLRSDYRTAITTARAGLEAAASAEDAFDLLTSHFFLAWALLHRGEWGAVRQSLQEGIAMAEKNEQHLWTLLFRLELAILHLEAFDFQGTLKLTEPGVRQSQEYRHSYGEMLGTILAGLAHVGLKRYPSACRCLSEVSARFERERLIMDWILSMPLSLGWSQYRLAQSEFEAARAEAERLCDLAAKPPERTYLALGHRLLAEIALRQRHWDKAQTELVKALAVLEEAEAPLAAWRVYALAAELYGEQGRKAEARRYRSHSAAIIDQLANSLDSGDPLRDLFLSAPPVRAVLGHTQGVRSEG